MKNQNSYRPLSKAALLWLVSVFCFLQGHSQTTNISGTVNTYHSVVKVVPSHSCVIVSNTAGLAPGRKVLLIQMKGASIVTNTTSAFGDTTSLNNAGNYEVATICMIIEDSVFFVHTIINDYTPTTGKVQLVQFARYVSANVTAPVTAPAWNNATGMGGVIAIFVEQDLILNENITADATGFAGGAYFNSSGTCANGITGYVFNPANTTQNGASKGEGVAEVAPNQNGGRGAPANGGGGGNNHNNGGGGGGNLSAGGIGGGNSSRVVLGRCYDAIPGFGAKPLNSWNGQKIFMGGGGGAGHANNATSITKGAEGGGIIFIHAANLVGNNRSISAIGGYGGSSGSDGAGGGGGGGTIIMDVTTYTGAITISANGGHGGDSNDGLVTDRCYGAGGGGGGGVVYFTGLSPAPTVFADGGLAGVEFEILRHSACTPMVAPNDGVSGQVIQNYDYTASLSISALCSVVLPVRLEFFTAKASSNTVNLNWLIPSPENAARFIIERLNADYEWKEYISFIPRENQQDYTAVDRNPLFGYNSYRLKIIGKNNQSYYSQVRSVYVGDKGTPVSIYPNPATDKVIIKGDFPAGSNIRLLDVSGKTVLHKKTVTANNAEIILPRLEAGIYILHVNESVEKLIIRH